MYLNDVPFPSVSSLEAYGENTVSSLFYLFLESTNVREISFDHVASHIGKAIGIMTLIRSIPFHIRSRRVYVPSDLMARVSIKRIFLSSIIFMLFL